MVTSRYRPSELTMMVEEVARSDGMRMIHRMGNTTPGGVHLGMILFFNLGLSGRWLLSGLNTRLRSDIA